MTHPPTGLLTAVTALQALVARYDTHSVVGGCFSYWLTQDRMPTDPPELLSPARQWPYLIGLLLATPEPADPIEFDLHDEELLRLLNTVFTAYAAAYFPGPTDTVDEDWLRPRDVAMPAFLAYFNHGFLGSSDQAEARLRRYLSPFDTILDAELGISASRAADISTWLIMRSQERLDQLGTLSRRETTAHHDLLTRAEHDGWDLERLRQEASSPAYAPGRAYFQALRDLGVVTRDELAAAFGERATNAFWSLLAIARGQGPGLTYPTEPAIATERSHYELSPGRAMHPFTIILYTGALARFEQHLTGSTHRESYFRTRDHVLEQEAAEHLRHLLGPTATLYTSVYETPHQEYEHDIVIRCDTLLLFVEAKASPVPEPFRDPERAYTRLQRAFGSDRGIQLAYQQGLRLWQRWHRGEDIPLCDAHGNPVGTIDASSVRDAHVLCVPHDHYGPLAVDLALLLEKPGDHPFPWAVNILDLAAIADAWQHFHWGAERFATFLRQRQALHGHVLCMDELEIVGFFINHGGLDWFPIGADKISFHLTDAKVFDDLYWARHGGPPVRYQPTTPVLTFLMNAKCRERPARARGRRSRAAMSRVRAVRAASTRNAAAARGQTSSSWGPQVSSRQRVYAATSSAHLRTLP